MSTQRPRRILYLQYANPATLPPLEHSSRILADAGWEVVFVGIGARGDADRLCFPPHPNIRVDQLPYRAPGLRQKLQYVRLTTRALFWTLRWRPNWIYASDVFGCPAVLLVHWLLHVPVLYHEHDAPSRDLERSMLGRLCMWARRAVIRRAAVRVAPSRERADLLREEFGAELQIVPVANFPGLAEVGPARTPIASQTLRVYYHGSISPLLVPLSVVRALPDLPSGVRLTIVGYTTLGQDDYRETLLDEARRLGVADRLSILAARPRYALLELCAEHDVGLALMQVETDDVNLRRIVGASNKISDYYARGLAAVVPDAPAWRHTFVDAGFAILCDPTSRASVAQALRWCYEHPAEVRAMGERARQRILNAWNYEREFQSVLGRLAG